MSNVNNYAFAKQMDIFKTKVLEPQEKKVEEARKSFENLNFQKADKENADIIAGKLDNYNKWLQFYLEFYKQGMTLINQHETLVNSLSKWYDVWYQNISNEGRQETELMSSQADILSGIFAEIYQELKPLNLDIKPPTPMNL